MDTFGLPILCTAANKGFKRLATLLVFRNGPNLRARGKCIKNKPRLEEQPPRTRDKNVTAKALILLASYEPHILPNTPEKFDVVEFEMFGPIGTKIIVRNP